MTKPLRCYVLRAEDGQIYQGAHPFESREEAARARDGMFGDGLGVPEVVELVEVVRCRDCEHDDSGDCPRIAREVHITNPDWHSEAEFTPDSRDWFCAYGKKRR